MQGKNKKMSQKIAHGVAKGLDFPIDSLVNVPVIHMTERRHLEVECCKGVLAYSDDSMTLNMGEYNIKIYGRDLVLDKLSRTTLSVSGEIIRIESEAVKKQNDI